MRGVSIQLLGSFRRVELTVTNRFLVNRLIVARRTQLQHAGVGCLGRRRGRSTREVVSGAKVGEVILNLAACEPSRLVEFARVHKDGRLCGRIR